MQRLSEHVKCHCKKYITIRHSNINLKDGAYFVVRSTRALKLQSLLKIYDGQGLFLGWVFFFCRDGANHGFCGDKEAS